MNADPDPRSAIGSIEIRILEASLNADPDPRSAIGSIEIRIQEASLNADPDLAEQKMIKNKFW